MYVAAANRCSQESGADLGGFPATAAAAAFAAAGGSAGGAPPSLGSSMQAAAAAYHLKTSAASSPYAAVNSIGLMDSLQTSMGCYPSAAGQNYHHHHSTTLSLFNHRKPRRRVDMGRGDETVLGWGKKCHLSAKSQKRRYDPCTTQWRI